MLQNKQFHNSTTKKVSIMCNIELVKSQMDLLKVLANERYRKAIISKAGSYFIKAICQGIHNVLKGNISISKYEQERLKKFGKVL
jgi:hypothetical protein